ncbi:MAG TPA: DUF2336 domain-containing protein [Alphaproteobacteria bacterium]|nr:DUF2336 domain-containing protein [Alphaproteobacteria bacterium]
MTERLSKADLEALISDRTAETRAKAAGKIAGEYRHGILTTRERAIAEDIFRTLLRDAELVVRRALSEQLRESRLVPHEIALALARDVDVVALPIIESSEVLTDTDLIALIALNEPPRQIAVARRRRVSAPVAHALVESQNRDVVAELVSNVGAELGEADLQKVLDAYGESETIEQRLAFRSALPATVSERLVAIVSERLRQHLMATQDLGPDTVSDLIQFSRERATLGIVWDSGMGDLDRFVRQLHARGRLTPTLLLRALCMGDTLFFQSGIAVLAALPLKNAVTLVYDKGMRGLKAIYEKAALPAELFHAFATAIDVVQQTELDVHDGRSERYRQRVIERILTQFDAIGADNIDYLLAKLIRRNSNSRDRQP